MDNQRQKCTPGLIRREGRFDCSRLSLSRATADLHVEQVNRRCGVGHIIGYDVLAYEVGNQELATSAPIDLEGRLIVHSLGNLSVGDLDPVQIRLFHSDAWQASWRRQGDGVQAGTKNGSRKLELSHHYLFTIPNDVA